MYYIYIYIYIYTYSYFNLQDTGVAGPLLPQSVSLLVLLCDFGALKGASLDSPKSHNNTNKAAVDQLLLCSAR